MKFVCCGHTSYHGLGMGGNCNWGWTEQLYSPALCGKIGWSIGKILSNKENDNSYKRTVATSLVPRTASLIL